MISHPRKSSFQTLQVVSKQPLVVVIFDVGPELVVGVWKFAVIDEEQVEGVKLFVAEILFVEVAMA